MKEQLEVTDLKGNKIGVMNVSTIYTSCHIYIVTKKKCSHQDEIVCTNVTVFKTHNLKKYYRGDKISLWLFKSINKKLTEIW